MIMVEIVELLFPVLQIFAYAIIVCLYFQALFRASYRASFYVFKFMLMWVVAFFAILLRGAQFFVYELCAELAQLLAGPSDPGLAAVHAPTAAIMLEVVFTSILLALNAPIRRISATANQWR